jgi:hypothetical protein
MCYDGEPQPRYFVPAIQCRLDSQQHIVQTQPECALKSVHYSLAMNTQGTTLGYTHGRNLAHLEVPSELAATLGGIEH